VSWDATKATEAHAAADDARHRPRCWQVLLSPWLELTRPRVAAACLTAATPRAFWTSFAAHAIVLAGLVVVLTLWSSTVRLSWPAPATVRTGAPAGIRPGMPAPDLDQRTFAEVWRDWHRDTLIGVAELTFMLMLLLAGAGVAFLAWLSLPRVHRTGSVLRSYDRSFRAVAACAALVVILTAGFGWAIVATEHWSAYELTGTRPTPTLFIDWDVFLVVAIPAAACFLLWWVGRAVQAVQAAEPKPEIPPRCEGCGYDLTHQPADARCPECGLSVAASLRLKRRPGSAWEGWGSAASWVTTYWRVLLRPRAFYSELKLRPHVRAAASFAVWNYVLLGVGGAAWVCVVGWLLYVIEEWLYGPDLEEVLAYAGVMLFWTPLCCWLGHRTIAALVVTWWLLRDYLPDYAWAAKVMAYESAFLWAFCCYWGVLASSFIFGKDWITRLIGPGVLRAFGVRGEIGALLLGTAGLSVLWLWRYHIAGRAIRWSNF
jgi:hypothetical protein